MEVSDDQRRMADTMGLHPGQVETWPLPLIDRFIWLKANRPPIDFQLEFESKWVRKFRRDR